MYRNILVPVAGDHAGTTDLALAAAKTLADDGGTITALTVVEAIPSYIAAELPPDVVPTSRDRALEHLRAFVGDGIKPIVRVGHAARSIIDHAAENDIDCIVIASHRPGLSDYFLGSTAAHVVRHAPCSVHVVR